MEPPTESPAEGFGRYLARERELRSITLEHVAEITRISVENLKALEEGRHDRLPGKVFVIGYIRGYARCIGLNPDEAVLRFQERLVAHGDTFKVPVQERHGWRLIAAVVVAVILAAGAAWLLTRK
jgi:cytoskeletal protein RodZ